MGAITYAKDDTSKSRWVLWMSTIAFTLCFSVWTLYSILAIKIQASLGLTPSQFGTMLAVPILIGSVTRLPLGMLTDRFGGKIVFTLLLITTAVPTFLLAYATEYWHFLACGAGFGLAGAGFAVGAAYVSVWTDKEHQGTALGIFGVGNVGSAITTFAVPFLLAAVSSWTLVPQIYAGLLLAMAVVFYLTTYDDPAHHNTGLTIGQRLAPLKKIQVWRFGLYYFLVFGGFVALGLYLPNYYMNVYGLDLKQIALITMIFLLPASFIRALGGWLSDKFGARQVMYAVLWTAAVSSLVLMVPRSEFTMLRMPYQFQPTAAETTVAYTLVTDKGAKSKTVKVLAVGDARGEEAVKAALAANPALAAEVEVHLASVKSGAIKPAHTRSTVPLTLNVWVFTLVLFVLGVALGIGKAAVYRYIPDYFPREVGVVGGIVGMLGGLGGFFLPLIWGYVLEWTGLYAITVFGFIFLVSAVSLAWLHYVVSKLMIPREMRLRQAIEEPAH